MEIWKKMCSSKKLPIKVTDEKRSRKIGLTVSSLDDLKKKANDVLNLGTSDYKSLSVYLEDGTEVLDDSYLFSLHNILLTISCAKPTVPCSGKDIFSCLYDIAFHV